MPEKRAWELRDPGAKAEARKYAHPVPSRTYIEQYLGAKAFRCHSRLSPGRLGSINGAPSRVGASQETRS